MTLLNCELSGSPAKYVGTTYHNFLRLRRSSGERKIQGVQEDPHNVPSVSCVELEGELLRQRLERSPDTEGLSLGLDALSAPRGRAPAKRCNVASGLQFHKRSEMSRVEVYSGGAGRARAPSFNRLQLIYPSRKMNWMYIYIRSFIVK
eukprot:3042996-Pyramimonas_sp.AAC.1